MGNVVALVFTLLWFVAALGIGIYVLVLATRFVAAHQRAALALEDIAKKLPQASGGA